MVIYNFQKNLTRKPEQGEFAKGREKLSLSGGDKPKLRE